MSRQIQIRRGTAAEHENFTGAIGEITMDTTNKTRRRHRIGEIQPAAPGISRLCHRNPTAHRPKQLHMVPQIQKRMGGNGRPGPGSGKHDNITN